MRSFIKKSLISISSTELLFHNFSYLAESVGKKICLQCSGHWFNSWVGRIHWRRDRLPTSVFFGLPCGSAGKEFT